VQTYSQELTILQLDSLYTKFIQLRAPELLPQTDQPSELTLEDRKCGMSLVHQIKSNLSFFSTEQQTILSKILQRPLLPNSIVSPNQYFRIHYTNIGTDAIFYDINLLAQALDSTYKFEIDYLGYPTPPPDGSEGGDEKYDVYVRHLGNLYGQTTSEVKVGTSRWTSFIEIDNDFPWYTSANPPKLPIDAARVTVAHEFHHSIQFGSYAPEDGGSYRLSDTYFYELTSTSMEEFVFDDVNDYYGYMSSYFRDPEAAMPNQNGYNLAIWNIFLKDNFGFGLIKRQWELIPSIAAILAINQSLNEVSTSFPRELNKFGIWTYFTNFRRIPGKYFEEGGNYPLITPTFTIQYPSAPPEMRSAPTANIFVKFNIPSNSDTLVAVVTNADAFAANDNSSQLFNFQYTLYSDPNTGQRDLTEDYSSTFSVSNPGFWSVSEILNNLLVREDSLQLPSVGSIEYAYPNPFYYSRGYLTGSLIFFPFDENVGETVDFNVYSVGMQIIFNNQMNIQILPGDQRGVSWDGKDDSGSKLASGVYIYVIKQGDEVIKGKVVIFNE